MSPTAWLASYPKSGNTWIRALLNALETDDDPDLNSLDAGSGHDGVGRWLEISLSNMDEAEAVAVERRSWASAIRSEPGYQRRKTHEPWLPVADGFAKCWQPPDARAIYIARDPRAVAVSWAHHNGISCAEAIHTMSGGDVVGPAGHSPHLAHPKSYAGSWSTHVTSWRDQTQLPLLFLTYEELSVEPVAVLGRITSWLGIDSDLDACARAVERCSFARLATREVLEGFIEAPSVDRVFFRRGSTESWREELSAELIAQIERDHSPVMRELGYLD